MIKVKISCFWEDDESIYKTMVRFSNGYDHWKNIKLVYNNKYDKLVILTRPFRDNIESDLNKLIVLLTEPSCSNLLMPELKKYTLPMFVHLPNWGNLSNEQYQAILNFDKIRKVNIFSSVTSELFTTNIQFKGYFLRLRFVHYLDQYIKSGFDLWGRPYDGSFFNGISCYKGSIQNKYDALWNYKYHFSCENSFYNNYFTEKISDAIISECLCFYDGCKNLELFIDERAFVKLDLEDLDKSFEKVINAINGNEWKRRIKYVRQQKKRLLTELNPMNIIWMAVNEKDVLKECML